MFLHFLERRPGVRDAGVNPSLLHHTSIGQFRGKPNIDQGELSFVDIVPRILRLLGWVPSKVSNTVDALGSEDICTPLLRLTSLVLNPLCQTGRIDDSPFMRAPRNQFVIVVGLKLE